MVGGRTRITQCVSLKLGAKVIRSGPLIFGADNSGMTRRYSHFLINVICFIAGMQLIFPGDQNIASRAMASETKTELKAGITEKYTYRCHGIRFSEGIMIDLSLGPDQNWILHLSHARFKAGNSASTEIRLYAGRRSVKHRMFPYKQTGKDLFIELGDDEKYVTRLATKGWFGYRLGVQNRVKRIRIPDARKMVREIRKFCSQE